MIRSMTAFARTQKNLEHGIICWELKSVNHRYMEASFRLPDTLRFLEIKCRGLLRQAVQRGKLDCQLKLESLSAPTASLQINQGLVSGLLAAGQQLASNWHLANDLSVSKVLTWPGVATFDPLDYDVLAEEALSLFSQALKEMVDYRETEGAALKRHVLTRVDLLKDEMQKAQSAIHNTPDYLKDKILSKLHFLEMTVPEGRIEQEIAILLTRMDVSEEFDRLQTHIVEVENILAQGDVAGRRLDFLMQELNREVNTIGSKSDSAELTLSTVAMKVLIEQMREQIQNIE